MTWAKQQVTLQRKGGCQSSSVSGVSADRKTNTAFSLKGHALEFGGVARQWYSWPYREVVAGPLALETHWVLRDHIGKKERRV